MDAMDQGGRSLEGVKLTWRSDQCLTSNRSTVSTWKTVNTCGGGSYMRLGLHLHLETNSPAGFTMEGKKKKNNNVNFFIMLMGQVVWLQISDTSEL